MTRPTPDPETRKAELSALLDRGYHYATALTGDPVLAEDILQDAWTAVLQAGALDGVHAGYLFRAIRSRFIDRMRREQRVPFDPTEDLVVPVGPEAERLIEADALWVGLLTLKPAEREALYLHHVEGFTAQEIGDRTNRPRNTILTLISRGRARLRMWFERRGLEVAG